MKQNGALQHRHQQRSIDEKYSVILTISHLTVHCMVKIVASMNLENLYVIYTPSHHLLRVILHNTKRIIHGLHKNKATMKWWDPHTKKFKYFSSAKFDQQKNKFGKGWSPGSETMLGTNISTLPTLKIDISDHQFIKYDIF